MEKAWIISQATAFIFIGLEILVLLALLWVIGRIYLKKSGEDKALITDDGPELHNPLILVESHDMEGRLIRFSGISEREKVLLFLSSTCSPCQQLMRELNATRRETLHCPDFILIMEAISQDIVSLVERYKLNFPIIRDEKGEFKTILGIERVPYGILVDRQGIVRMKGVINNGQQLESLIRRRGRYASGVIWLSMDEVVVTSEI